MEGEQVCNLRTVEGRLCIDDEEVDCHGLLPVSFSVRVAYLPQRHCHEEVWRHTLSIVQPKIGEDLLAPFTIAKMQDAIVAINRWVEMLGGGWAFWRLLHHLVESCTSDSPRSLQQTFSSG